MTVATAVAVGTSSNDHYYYCVEDGFSAESLIKFLKDELGEEFPWISFLNVEPLNWDKSTLDINKVFNSIYTELDKIE